MAPDHPIRKSASLRLPLALARRRAPCQRRAVGCRGRHGHAGRAGRGEGAAGARVGVVEKDLDMEEIRGDQLDDGAWDVHRYWSQGTSLLAKIQYGCTFWEKVYPYSSLLDEVHLSPIPTHPVLRARGHATPAPLATPHGTQNTFSCGSASRAR